MATCSHEWLFMEKYSSPGELSRFRCASCSAWGYYLPGTWGKRTIHPYKGTPTEKVLREWAGTLERSYSLSSPVGVGSLGCLSPEQYRDYKGRLQYWSEPNGYPKEE